MYGCAYHSCILVGIDENFKFFGSRIAPILPGGVFRFFRIDRVRRVVGGETQ